MFLNVDMNLFFELEDHLDEDGRARIPDDAPGNCDDSDRVFADCFPRRGGATAAVVNEFDGNGASTQDWVDEFATVFGQMLRRVKIGTTLTTLEEPEDWPDCLDDDEACWDGEDDTELLVVEENEGGNEAE